LSPLGPARGVCVYGRQMPRKPRAFRDGIFHIAAHGSDDRRLFADDRERNVFLGGLERIADRFELGVVAYTLMTNHYHGVVSIPDERLSKALQQLHWWWSCLHNKLNHRSAHLFRAHFFAREIESDADLISTCLYVAANPVEASLVDDPLAWPWSSAAATAGLAPPRISLDLEPLRRAFGGNPMWRRRYGQLLTLRAHRRCRADIDSRAWLSSRPSSAATRSRSG
jgi:putative transposase